MPYIEKTGNKAIQEQLWQWESVMHDNNIDGFNGWGCKQKSLQSTLASTTNNQRRSSLSWRR